VTGGSNASAEDAADDDVNGTAVGSGAFWVGAAQPASITAVIVAKTRRMTCQFTKPVPT
jgi:hypothetical protein